MIRPIAIGLSPNTQTDDYASSAKMVLTPRKWKNGEYINKVEVVIGNLFKLANVISFNAGRSALYAILKCLNIGKGDEVLIQSFTCIAVPNSVLWTGATPIYVDIDESLNIDVTDAAKKITHKTKALLVQHTFGIAADMDKILHFCKKNKLYLIEDCAHALGATYKGKKVGTFGDAAFLSFGRDKVVSAVFGGAVITTNETLAKKIRQFRNSLAYPSNWWIFQQLVHPLIAALVLPTYSIGIGKVLLYLFQKLKLLSFPVYQIEKFAKQPKDFPKKMPNALCFLAFTQFGKLERFNAHRKKIAQFYFQELKNTREMLPKADDGAIYLRFTLLSNHADEIRFQAKKKGMLLGNWYSHIIDPKGVDFNKIGYTVGSCPRAEKIARQSINLPTYPTFSQLQTKEVISLIKKSEYYRTL